MGGWRPVGITSALEVDVEEAGEVGFLDDLAVGRFEDGAGEGLGGVDGGEVVRGILEQGDDFRVVAVVVPGRSSRVQDSCRRAQRPRPICASQ